MVHACYRSAVIETRCPAYVQDCLITYTDLEINGRPVSLRAKDNTQARQYFLSALCMCECVCVCKCSLIHMPRCTFLVSFSFLQQFIMCMLLIFLCFKNYFYSHSVFVMFSLLASNIQRYLRDGRDKMLVCQGKFRPKWQNLNQAFQNSEI